MFNYLHKNIILKEMNTNLILMLVAILVIVSGVSFGFFMNSLWDDSKLITYINLDSDSAGQDNNYYYSGHHIPTTYPL